MPGGGESFGAACGSGQRFWETMRVKCGVEGQRSKGREGDGWGLNLASGLVHRHAAAGDKRGPDFEALFLGPTVWRRAGPSALPFQRCSVPLPSCPTPPAEQPCPSHAPTPTQDQSNVTTEQDLPDVSPVLSALTAPGF